MATLDEVLAGGGATWVDGEVRLGGAELEAEVGRVAACLAARGVRQGAAVAWQLPNSVLAALLYRACWRLGAVAVPLHHGAGAVDVEGALAGVGPAVIVAAEGLPAGSHPGALSPRAFADDGYPAAPSAAVDDADVAVVLFTSGSSGRPKGVVHTHGGLATKARSMAAVHGLGGADTVLMPAPLAHISGLLNGILVPGVAGLKTVLMRRWDPVVALELIEQERVTFMIGPPTFFISLIEAPGFSARRVATLRLVSCGGAGVTPAFVERAAAALGCHVKRTYGSTEAPTMTTSGPDDVPERARNTDGRPTPGAEVRVCDPTTGNDRAPGEVGEVWVRGSEVFARYLDEESTAQAFAGDRWFRTGDLGVLDAAGWLTITGRIKDVIIRGGENITAAEVESVLEAHPQVRQAVVVGYPDEKMGQRVCAFIVAVGTIDLAVCRAWLAERGVTRFKWPERVVQLGSFPLLGPGKVDRAALEQLAASGTPDPPTP